MRPLLLTTLLTLACGDGTSGTSSDAGNTTDAGASFTDAGQDPDGGDEPSDAGDEPSDAGEEPVDAGETPDAGGPVFTGPGQCGRDSDCASGDCSPRSPGGFCVGCADDGACDLDDGESYTCNFTGCNQDCSTDADCHPGLRCTSSGACVLRPCSAGCPAPYVCEGGFCSRPPCDTNCPSGQCSEGYCLVDR